MNGNAEHFSPWGHSQMSLTTSLQACMFVLLCVCVCVEAIIVQGYQWLSRRTKKYIYGDGTVANTTHLPLHCYGSYRLICVHMLFMQQYLSKNIIVKANDLGGVEVLGII